jgi:DNA-binding transcriptional MerR regulator
MTDRTMTIQAFSRAVGRSPSAIRNYERLGLFKAERDSTGRRLYRPDDVIKVRRIAEGRRINQFSGLGRPAPEAA